MVHGRPYGSDPCLGVRTQATVQAPTQLQFPTQATRLGCSGIATAKLVKARSQLAGTPSKPSRKFCEHRDHGALF